MQDLTSNKKTKVAEKATKEKVRIALMMGREGCFLTSIEVSKTNNISDRSMQLFIIRCRSDLIQLSRTMKHGE